MIRTMMSAFFDFALARNEFVMHKFDAPLRMLL